MNLPHFARIIVAADANLLRNIRIAPRGIFIEQQFAFICIKEE
jgi:hypothetical protein